MTFAFKDDSIVLVIGLAVFAPVIVALVNWVACVFGLKNAHTRKKIKDLRDRKVMLIAASKAECEKASAVANEHKREHSRELLKRQEKAPNDADMESQKLINRFVPFMKRDRNKIEQDIKQEIEKWSRRRLDEIDGELKRKVDSQKQKAQSRIQDAEAALRVQLEKPFFEERGEYLVLSVVAIVSCLCVPLFCSKYLSCELNPTMLNLSDKAGESLCQCHVGYARMDVPAAGPSSGGLLWLLTSPHAKCQGCPKGSFLELRDGPKCISCPRHHTTKENVGAPSPDACVCDAGYGHDRTAITPQCIACAPGFAKPAVGNESCTVCAESQYQPQNGAEECFSCPKYSWSPKGSISPASCQCLEGFETGQGAKPGQPRECQPCGESYYKDSLSNTKCSSCPANMAIPPSERPGIAETQCQCKAEYYLAAPMECARCPPHSFKPNIENSDSCACKAGYEFQGIECVPCPRNTYKPESGNDDICIDCLTDGATADPGSLGCTCLKGFQPRHGNGADGDCEPCPRNWYKSTVSNSKCSLCPKNKHTNEAGSKSLSDCKHSYVSVSGGHDIVRDTKQIMRAMKDSVEGHAVAMYEKVKEFKQILNDLFQRFYNRMPSWEDLGYGSQPGSRPDAQESYEKLALGTSAGKNDCPFRSENHFWTKVQRSSEFTLLQGARSCKDIRKAFREVQKL